MEEEEEDVGEKPVEREALRRRGAFTRRWCRGFMRRTGLSLLMAHAKRRPDPRPEREAQEAEFKEAVRDDLRRLTHNDWRGIHKIVNMDETSMRTISLRQRTIDRKGADNVQIHHSGDDKKCLTLIAWVTAGGMKGPLIVVMKGKTGRCEERVRAAFADEILARRLYVLHSLSGWVDGEVAAGFLRVFKEWCWEKLMHMKWIRPTLIWDVYSSHRSPATKAEAEKRQINLRFIPAGKTDALQPLDKRYGELKSRARAAAVADSVLAGAVLVTVNDALRHFLAAWDAMEVDSLAGAWDPILRE